MLEAKFNDYIEASAWTFAKTMPQWPHWYTVRNENNSDAFSNAVAYIREHGFDCSWSGQPYRYYCFGEHYYWTMGAPIEETVIINHDNLTL